MAKANSTGSPGVSVTPIENPRNADLQLVLAALPEVWNAIGSDFAALADEVGEELDNERAIEGCIDANRLSAFGYPRAEAALDRLLSEHGYDYPALLSELASRVKLA